MRIIRLFILCILMTFVLTTAANAAWTVSITPEFFDMDHYSESDRGIVEHKWSWKEATAYTWNTFGSLNSLVNNLNMNIQDNKDYLIRYEVLDKEGAWSFPEVKLITTRPDNLPPVARFTATPNPVVANKPLTIVDLSYDPNGDPIVQWEWTIQDPDNIITVTASPPSSLPKQGVNKITLKVRDSKGEWSDGYSQDVTVIPDNRPPVALFTIIPSEVPTYDYSPVTFDTSATYDPDGDPIVAYEWQYRINGGAWTPLPASIFSSISGDLFHLTFDNLAGHGTYSIRLRVLDQPVLPQLTPMWSNWCVRDITILEGFEVEGMIIPNPGERGRKIKIIGKAVKPSDPSQAVDVDSMRCTIVEPIKPDGNAALPSGMSTQTLNMTYDPVNEEWTVEHLVPDKEALGAMGITYQDDRWPADGFYRVKVIGRKGVTEKDDLLDLEIKGHIFERTIIRTKHW